VQTVGIKSLKNALSKHIRAVAAGETVLVTDRGKVVAEIVPPRVAPDASSAERQMAVLERQGLLRRASIPPSAPLPERKPVMSFADMMRDLDDSRSDR
jgi:antitoxin (DNA-binding transcriptional repressor) of toxin-antitoxin stability system